MSVTAPPILARTVEDLRTDIAQKLSDNTGWQPVDPQSGAPDQVSEALIAIAARFGEIAIERLNQAPEKNLLAFLDLLGASRLPPEPARVPLTFTGSSGSTTDAVVPAGTQIAATAIEGEETPVIFATERELTAVAANLRALIAVDAERDLIADYSSLIATPVPEGVQVFSGDRANDRYFCIGCDAPLSYPQLTSLTLTFQVSPDAPANTPDVRTLQWESWDGATGKPLTATDTTQALQKTGQVSFQNLQQLPESTVGGVTSRWLRCRLTTPVSPATDAGQGMVRAAQLPLLSDIKASAVIDRSALGVESAFADGQAVDVSRAFLPFGDKPRIGDVFYISQPEALSQPGGVITIPITLANPVPDTGGSTTVPSADLKLRWETWDGAKWVLLGDTTPTGAVAGTTLTDSTKAFTKNGNVRITLPQTLATTPVNGVESHWVRVHIIAGNYGVDATYVTDATRPGGFVLNPATYSPPLVTSISFAYQLTTPAVRPDAVVSFNNAQFADLAPALAAGKAAPFVGFPSQPPALYCVFTLPPGRKAFPNRAVSLYHSVRQPPYGEKRTPLSPGLRIFSPAAGGQVVTHVFTLTNTSADSVTCDLTTLGGRWPSSVAPPQVTLLSGRTTDVQVTVNVPVAASLPASISDRGFLRLKLSNDPAVHTVAFETRVGPVPARNRELRFEYWNGQSWARLLVSDGTNRLTQPGVVEFLGPADIALSERFGIEGYWIRALFEAGDDQPVQMRALLPNTTFAVHAITLRNEVLGSSDASVNQQMKTARNPVLTGPQLDVRESDATSADAWIRWTEMPDFHASGAQDRHYVLDPMSGRVSFGDGVQGRIPPRGIGNVRMTRYQTGGGSIGNRAAGTIVQLKTTVPYIEKVMNLEPARGGMEAESNTSLVSRAPRMIRHGGRAVAFQDFEDLARNASPEVARSKSVPLRRLSVDPLGNSQVPGVLSVIVVPQSSEAKPLPSSGLMTEVADYLRSLATPTLELVVVGPLYVRVDVTIEVSLTSLEGATDVEQAVLTALRSFLHPLTGGRDGTGWDFGREPHTSDLHALVSDVPGVDHIRTLGIEQVEEPKDALLTGRFLVYSGQHRITLTFPGAE
jgi:hypothetical protein